MVCNGQAGEARQTFSKLHDLNNALGGEFTKFVPEAQVQSDSMVGTGILRERENVIRGSFWEAQWKAGTQHVSSSWAGTSVLPRALPGGVAEF